MGTARLWGVSNIPQSRLRHAGLFLTVGVNVERVSQMRVHCTSYRAHVPLSVFSRSEHERERNLAWQQVAVGRVSAVVARIVVK